MYVCVMGQDIVVFILLMGVSLMDWGSGRGVLLLLLSLYRAHLG